jgi:cyclopropane fatty-acyl-phospholipid synthase-like methyltransferase
MPNSSDPFFEPYDRHQVAYGLTPSAALHAFVKQIGGGGLALDLGAGAGRDSIALAEAGFRVRAVDRSQRGLQRIEERAAKAGIAERVTTQLADVCDLVIDPNHYDVIVATTLLDHVAHHDAVSIWKRMTAGLTDRGVLFVEVHSTEDPGSDQPPGSDKNAPVSETAEAVVNYFSPNQLLHWAVDEAAQLRVLRYEERLEWDYTHGPEHQHGKAILLAVRRGSFPDWYGQPPAFPRR